MSDSTFRNNPVGVVETMIAAVDDSPTECDGCSRLVSHNLTLLGISHKIMVGTVVIENPAFFPDWEKTIDPHFWVELHDDRSVMWCIDFRLRCYMAPYGIAEKMPHGLFKRGLGEHPGVIYDSYSEMPGQLLPSAIYQLLQAPHTIPGYEAMLAELHAKFEAQTT